MKKYVLLLMLACALPVQAADMQAKDLVGKWLCLGNYADIHVYTFDEYEYFADGTSRSMGEVINDLGFSYRLQNTGRWQLANGKLTEIAHTEKVERMHSEQVQAALKASPELSQFENEWFKILSENGKTDADNTIELDVAWKDAPDSFSVKNAEMHMKGGCRRVSSS